MATMKPNLVLSEYPGLQDFDYAAALGGAD